MPTLNDKKCVLEAHDKFILAGNTTQKFCDTFQQKWPNLSVNKLQSFRKELERAGNKTTTELKKMKMPAVGQNQKRAIPEGGKVDKVLWRFVNEMRGIRNDIVGEPGQPDLCVDDEESFDDSIETGNASWF